MRQSADSLRTEFSKKFFRLFIFATLLLSAVITFFYTVCSLESHSQSAFEHSLMLASTIAPDLASGNKDNLKQSLAAIEKTDTIAFSALLSDRNEVLAIWQRNPNDHRVLTNLQIKTGEFKLHRSLIYSGYSFKGPDHRFYKIIIGTDFLVIARNVYGYLFCACLSIILIIGLSAFLIWKYLFESFISPVIKISRLASTAAAEKDLTAVLPTTVNNEIGALALAFNQQNENFRIILQALSSNMTSFIKAGRQLNMVGEDLAGSAKDEETKTIKSSEITKELAKSFMFINQQLETISKNAQTSITAINQMDMVNSGFQNNISGMEQAIDTSSHVVNHIVDSVQNTSSNIDKITKDVLAISDSIQELDATLRAESANTKASLTTADELSKNAISGMKAMEETLAGMKDIKDISTKIFNSINVLTTHVQDISTILHVIEGITKQTNLLAINAAIIAAQSGEQGRSFAVVSEEISALAARTKTATVEISELVETIQHEAQQTTLAMSQGAVVVKQGLHLSHEAANSMTLLQETAQQSTLQAHTIAEQANAQALEVQKILIATKQITSTLQELDSNTNQQGQEALSLNETMERLLHQGQTVTLANKELNRRFMEVMGAIEAVNNTSNIINQRLHSHIKTAQISGKLIADITQQASQQAKDASTLISTIDTIKNEIQQLERYVAEFKM